MNLILAHCEESFCILVGKPLEDIEDGFATYYHEFWASKDFYADLPLSTIICDKLLFEATFSVNFIFPISNFSLT